MTGGSIINKKLDWLLIGCWLFLMIFGWMNIFSSSVGDAGAAFSISAAYTVNDM